MAKITKKQPAKTKKRSTKYSKLAAVCSKELAAKKKALILAEKRLATATKSHQELLAEVARLDMLERSLRAVNEGLEPPQNIKYVYTYPNWIWQYPNQWPYPQPYYYNSGNTITLGNVGTSGQFNLATTNADCVNTVTYNSGSLIGSSATSGSNLSGTLLCNNNIGAAWTPATQTFDSTACEAKAYSQMGQTAGTADLVIDLSTGAAEDADVAKSGTDVPATDAVGV